MLAVRRLLAVGSVLTLIAVLATAHLWGQPQERAKSKLDSTNLNRPRDASVDLHDVEEKTLSRFADQPLLLYRTEQGETSLALQVKPRLQAQPALPRDYVVLVDTAAHVAGGDLKSAQTLLQQLLGKLGKDDRVAISTVNTRTHDLTKGLQPVRETANALKKLDEEFPAGAVNLRDALPEAIQTFDGKADRQRLILFLGSGQSIAGPIDADLRASLSKDMVSKRIAFFCVPLGGILDPYNLHGFANFTGGKVVRFGVGSTPEQWVVTMLEAAAQPILYDAALKLPEKIAEVVPTQLPPLRPDVPTLVIGKFAGPVAKGDKLFDYTLTGNVAGKAVTVRVSETQPAPDERNFFLVAMMDQWKARKDRPSLLQADRALAYAFENNQLARADLLAQADWALEKKKFEVAARLYRQALQADPTSDRAKLGLKFVEDLRTGRLTLDDLKKQMKYNSKDFVTRINPNGKAVRLPAEQLFAQPPKQDNPPPLGPDQGEQNRILDIKARQAVADQEQIGVVNDAIRQANRLVLTDPDTARDFLKRTLDSVRSNPEITNAAKASLADRMERALQQIDIQGAVVKRDQDEALRLLANANARTTLRAEVRIEQNRVRERMRVYHNLMNQAREQQAYRHAQAIRRDLIDQGLPVPPAVTAGYAVGLAGFHLREIQELRRIREERWLATMLEVERSHIPFPDEPPVEYPPSAVWKELSEMRKARYESSTFGADLPIEGRELQKRLSTRVKWEGIEDARATLSDALDALAKRYGLSFDINDKAFEMEGAAKDGIGRTEIAQPTPIPPMDSSLGSIIRRILRRVPSTSGTTFLIRRDTIEITTGTFAAAEKTLRVYPVADLVMPIPNSINYQMLAGSATLFGLSAGALGGFAGIGGLRGVGLGGVGGLGLAGLGGGIGGLAGIAGGNLGGIGGVGGIAGLGGQGFQNLGVAGGGGGGGQFQGGFQGQGNMGMGGVTGIGGQQLGQFGNLGGQFGLQGGNQSQILLTLIRQVVGRPKDWAIQFDPITGQPLNPLDDQNAAPEGLNQENNQLGYYPPALALCVKASSTIHTRPSNLIINPNAVNAALPGRRDNEAVAAGKKRDPNVKVAGQGDERPDDKDANKGPPLDPRIVWQDALAKGVQNPGLIIATADFLVLTQKFDHAAEFLKADLRQGIVVEPWVFKALALALRMSGGSSEEIERAEVSSADIEPKNAAGYLQAAQALAQDEKYALALAFCRQAALLEPGTPHAYEDALQYAELARDSKAMEWAAGHLLRQDWPVNNKQIQERAIQKMESLVKLLNQQGKQDESKRLLDAIAGQRVRDLVIKLNWQGDADLDLHVLEPAGSLCSALHRQTIGGGVLIGDLLADMTRETYLAAEGFPGEYEIEIEKVCGHPLNNKAQLRIIRHQGTPDETEQLLTVELKSRHSERIKLKLDEGRRTETAYVAPPDAQKPPEATPTSVGGTGNIMNKLRLLADPEVVGVARGLSGSVASQGRTILPSEIKSGKQDTHPAADDRTLYQARVRSFVQNSLNVTAQAVISADRRSVRLSMSPVFNTATGVRNAPTVVNPTLPGGR